MLTETASWLNISFAGWNRNYGILVLGLIFEIDADTISAGAVLVTIIALRIGVVQSCAEICCYSRSNAQG